MKDGTGQEVPEPGGLPAASCRHEWERAPDRDRIAGGFGKGEDQYAILVFWCRRCHATATSKVTFETEQDPE